MNFEHDYRLLLDNLTTAILQLDENLQVEYLNPAAEMLLQVSDERVNGLPVSRLFTEDGQDPASFKNALNTEHQYTKRQAQLTLASGQDITVDYTVTPVIEQPGTSLLVELHQLDRLLRISREETIISAQQSSRNLIRGLAHEIKNPLGGLRGAAQLLARELPAPELHDYTDIIIAEADRLRNLVDRLLGPHTLPQRESLNIHEVLERVVNLVDAETSGEITFTRDYDPSIPDMYGDREQLIQAVLNVLRNAMQAIQQSSQGDPCISVTTRIQRQFTIGKKYHRLVCRIDVCDNGVGIPDGIKNEIFFPMVTGRPEGTGLGLSLSQSIVNQHQGLIECTSEPGNTCFSIYLPLELSND